MTVTVKVTYTAQGSPDTIMTFDLTTTDIESIKEELPPKKKELDSKFNVDPQKSNIGIDESSIKDLDYRLDWFLSVIFNDIICSSVITRLFSLTYVDANQHVRDFGMTHTSESHRRSCQLVLIMALKYNI